MTTPSPEDQPTRRTPAVPVIAVGLGLAGLVGAVFTGFLTLFVVYGLAGSTVGLDDGDDWRAFLVLLVTTAVLVALGPLVMFIGRRDRRWLLAAIGAALLVLVVGLIIGVTAG